jgi:hypothetical protein
MAVRDIQSVAQSVVGRVRRAVNGWNELPSFDMAYPAPETTLRLSTVGMGDVMIARQMGHSFLEYLANHGDPALGEVSVTLGGISPVMDLSLGDHDVFWWYSFGPYDDDQSDYLREFFEPKYPTEPDLMLCASAQFRDAAEDAGYDAMYFPIGVAASVFRPLGLDRSGLGYAGSKGHKSTEDEEMVLGPVRHRPDFEWVSGLETAEQLSLWYNSRALTFGLTKPGQREWGTVNSRVFETLATATPFVMERHPTVEDVLGFEFPYQVSSREECRETVEALLADPEATRAEFAEFSERVRDEHGYVDRLAGLFDRLEE